MKKIIVFHTEKGQSGVVSGRDRREQVRISSPAAVFYSILSCLLPELKRKSGVFTIRESGRTFAMLKLVGILLALVPLLLTAAERCAVCRKTLAGEVFEYKGKIYCTIRCMKTVLPKCAVCRQPITGEYSVFTTPEGGRRSLCRHCSRLTRCFACDLPGRTKQLADGRFICDSCGDQAIRSPEEIRKLLEDVRGKLERILGDPTDCPYRFRSVSYPELLKVADMRTSDTVLELGLCRAQFTEQRSGDRREIVKIECEILMLSHLPRWRFIEIAAHELAHHWQFHYAPYLRNRVLQEGFAEYVSFLVNREYGQQRLNRRLEKRNDPVYGAGFRRIRAVADREGIAGVKRLLRDAQSVKDAPPVR